MLDIQTSVAPLFILAAQSDHKGAIAGFAELLGTVQSRLDEIDAAETARLAGSKEVSPMATAFSKDEAGRSEAETFLRENVWPLIVDWIDDDPAKTFHVHELMKSSDGLMKYLRDEVSYFNLKMTPKSGTVSEKMELKRTYNTILGFYRQTVSNAAVFGYDWQSDENLQADKKGQPTPKVRAKHGIRDDGETVATGRYAKVYHLTFELDGEPLEDIVLSDLVRLIWDGYKRIGKGVKDLAEMLDTESPGWMKSDWKGVTLKVNGHTLKIGREG